MAFALGIDLTKAVGVLSVAGRRSGDGGAVGTSRSGISSTSRDTVYTFKFEEWFVHLTFLRIRTYVVVCEALFAK